MPQRIAVKILSPEVASLAAYADQFEREARLAAKLQHPNILSVIDFGVASVPAAEGRSQAVRFLCMMWLEKPVPQEAQELGHGDRGPGLQGIMKGDRLRRERAVRRASPGARSSFAGPRQPA